MTARFTLLDPVVVPVSPTWIVRDPIPWGHYGRGNGPSYGEVVEVFHVGVMDSAKLESAIERLAIYDWWNYSDLESTPGTVDILGDVRGVPCGVRLWPANTRDVQRVLEKILAEIGP